MWKAGGKIPERPEQSQVAREQVHLEEPTGPIVVAGEADGSREDVGRGHRCAAGAEESRRDPAKVGGDPQRRRRD